MTNSPVAQIKERLTIEEVVSSYITLEKYGNSLKAKCPFHNEKTPSFFVSRERGTYYCFGCAAGGDIFTFVEEFEGLDFKGALKLLAEKAGVTISAWNKEQNSSVISEKERLYEITEEATKFFENNLKDNKKVITYLESRGLQSKTIKDFRIGFALNDWRTLYAYLRNKNFSDKEIELAGLAKKTEKGLYDRFRGRVMFPISDSSGRVIAFSGRIFEDDGKSAKYLNSPETPIFSKSAVLYGIDKAKESIRKNNFSIIVEGQFDLILSHQAGFKNTVATSGTALADSDKSKDNNVNNLGLVSRLSQNIIFIFDGDKAGFAASVRATPLALALFSDMNVKATEIPEGMDPADLISQKGPDAWREVVRNSKHIIEFLIDRYILNNKDKDVLKTKLEIQSKVIPYLVLIKNPIKKSHFISLISNKTGISEEDIREQLKNEMLKDSSLEQDNSEEVNKDKVSVLKKDHIIRRLLGIVLWQNTLKQSSINVLELTKEIEDTLKVKLDTLLENVSKNKEDLVFEAEIFYEGKASLVKEIEELLNNLKTESLKEELALKMRELYIAEENKDLQKSKQILMECQIINNKIEALKDNNLKKQ